MNNEQYKGQNTKTVLPSRKISQWKKNIKLHKRGSQEKVWFITRKLSFSSHWT